MPSVNRRAAAIRYFTFLFAAFSIIAAAAVGFSLYERSMLGENSLGIGKAPLYTPYYLGRTLLTVALSALLIVGLYRLAGGSAPIHRTWLGEAQRTAAYAMLAATAAGIALFIADPVLFYELALEDHALEWASALLPITCAGLFAWIFWRILRSPQGDDRRVMNLTLTSLMALVLFVLGMEEISWMQRVFEIETPAAFAGNQQQEMNLHNMHSITVGTAHKLAMYALLIVLPFLVETAPRTRLAQWLEDYLPTRFVLAISAPFAAYNYNAWNFVLTPVIVCLTVAILLCHAVAAWRRADRQEMTLFTVLAAFVGGGQALFLAFGANAVRMWDYSEYAELFMAVGLAVFSWQTVSRLAARYPVQASQAAAA